MADETAQDTNEQPKPTRSVAQIMQDVNDAVTSGIQSTITGLTSERDIIDGKLLSLDQQITQAEVTKARLQTQLENVDKMLDQFNSAKTDLSSMRNEHVASIRRWEDIRDGRNKTA